MNNSDEETPKRISPEQVEIVGLGVHAKPSDQEEAIENNPNFNKQQPFGGMRGMRVMNAGPLGLLFIPLVIVLMPVVLVGLVILLILAGLFGRSVFKVIRFKR